MKAEEYFKMNNYANLRYALNRHACGTCRGYTFRREFLGNLIINRCWNCNGIGYIDDENVIIEDIILEYEKESKHTKNTY